MGACCCKNAVPSESYAPPGSPVIDPTEPRIIVPKSVVETVIIDRLVLELLSLIASFVDNDEESPVSLVKLHVIADKEEGWFQVVSSMVSVIPLDSPLGPSAITIVFDDCPLPSKDSVIKLTQLFGLSAMRALMGEINVKVERNICVVLCCIADKLAGPNSVAVLTEETLDYMLSFLMFRREPRIVLFAMIALEKFAHSTENKVTIKQRLDKEEEHPLMALEVYADSDDFIWRQVGFAAKWALDNIFIVQGRPLAFETVDMSNINAILNTQDASEYLKISGDGLEARCDSYSFESVRCTFEVSVGCWYYECTIITPGVMQIGWATRGSHFMNHDEMTEYLARMELWAQNSAQARDTTRDVTASRARNLSRSRTTSRGRKASRRRTASQSNEAPPHVDTVTPPAEPAEPAEPESPRHVTALQLLGKEGFGIGDDLYSLSYDGCRKLIWHEAKPSPLKNMRAWKPGDVVGCLIDMDIGEAVFYLNGEHVRTCTELFETTRQGFFAAASFMAFQQCRFNFGSEPFQYPPERSFHNFNDCGFLTEDEKKVVPRRFYLEKLRNSSIKENSCTLCFDNDACCVLEPCMHGGFCSLCTAQVKECPLCRAVIMNVRVVPA